ncbi:MAG TPA: MFS transporter [Vicinamibacterales bacterium]|nr:MFS transporter [Vicinamibacterales bacterium]
MGTARVPSSWTLYGTFVLTGMVNTVLGPVLPWLGTRWDLSDRGAGALFSAEFAGGLLAGVASGWLTTRFGTGRVMSVGALLMAAGMTAAIAPLPAVAVGMFVAGLGLGCVIPPMNLLVVRITPHRASAALARLNLAWGSGAMGWPIAVALIQPLFGVASSLVLLAGCLVAASVYLDRVPEVPPPAEVRPESRTTTNVATAALLGLLIVLYTGIETGIGGWVTEYARRITERGAASASQVPAAMFWAGVTLGRAAIALGLPDRRAPHALFGGLALAAVSLPWMLLASGGRSLAIATFCVGLGLAPVFPVTIAAVARYCPPRVAAALIALAGLGGATVPWLVGVVSDASGSLGSGLLTLLGLVVVLIAGHAVRVARDRRSPGSGSDRSRMPGW